MVLVFLVPIGGLKQPFGVSNVLLVVVFLCSPTTGIGSFKHPLLLKGRVPA